MRNETASAVDTDVRTTPSADESFLDPRLGPHLFVVALGFGVAGALTVIERRPDYLCRHWEATARTAEPTRARQLVAKLNAYGSFGVPSLVRLSAAAETHVAEAACSVLKKRLERATRGESTADEAAAVQIGEELQRLLQQQNGATPPTVVATALALLEATGGMAAARRLDVEQRTRLIETCDAALRRAAARPSPLAAILPGAETTPLVEPVRPPVVPGGAATDKVVAATGVGEPKTPAGVASAANTISPPARVDEPRSAANAAARIEPPTETIVDSSVRPVSTAPLANAPIALSKNPLRRGDEATPLTAPQEVPAGVQSGGDPSRLDAWALFARVDADPRAFAELRRRGFSPREIDVGRYLTSSDPIERRRYTQMLPSLTGVDIRPWLLHLCDDADDEVRRAAATIMATTNDPTLLDRLRSMSLDDTDDGFAKLRRVRWPADRSVRPVLAAIIAGCPFLTHRIDRLLVASHRPGTIVRTVNPDRRVVAIGGSSSFESCIFRGWKAS